MQGGQFRPELARAYSQYLGEKGGTPPNVAREILPVVVMDDQSAYPPFRPWNAGSIAVAVAGKFPRIGIMNTDGFPPGTSPGSTGGEPRSVVVIDRITVSRDANLGGDLFLTITHTNLHPFIGTTAPADDIAPEKDPSAAATRPQIANVAIGFCPENATLFGNVQYPSAMADQKPLVLNGGPWVLGPGQILYLERNLAPSALLAYFSGRYYPAP